MFTLLIMKGNCQICGCENVELKEKTTEDGQTKQVCEQCHWINKIR